MIQFTQLPENNAPLGGELRCIFELDDVSGEAEDHLLQLLDARTGNTLATRRYARCFGGSADIAPMLRPQACFTPAAGSTGFFDDEVRTVQIVVRADDARSDALFFLPVGGVSAQEAGKAVAPGLRTTMPLCRLISPVECEELTLFAEEPLRVTVTAHMGGERTESSSYLSTHGGWQLFRLNMNDLSEETVRVTVEAGEWGTVTYSVAPAPHGSRRLAWRSAAGSVEHYTFPFETVVAKQTVKERVYGAAGHEVVRITSERLVTLRSAFEREEVMEALAGIVSSSQAWLLCGEEYLPVDVVTSEVEINHHGTYDALEVAIRPTRKEVAL